MRRFCTRAEHLERIARELEHPALGFCLDTGHALVAGGPEGAHRFFEAMEKKLVAFHLADTAGDRDMHIETPPFAHIDHGSYSVEAWRELVGRTKALALAAVPELSALTTHHGRLQRLLPPSPPP